MSVLPSPKELLPFAGRFLLVFFLLVPLWFVLTPVYNRLLASSANIVLALVEHPHIHTLVGWKYNIVIVRPDTLLTAGAKLQGFTGYLTHFNLILMAALVLAPRRIEWRRRGVILAIAFGILLVIHICYLVIGVKFFEQPELEAFQDTAGRLYVWGTNFYLSIVSQLLPVVIWMALYRAGFIAFGQPPDAEEEPAAVEIPEKEERKRKRT